MSEFHGCSHHLKWFWSPKNKVCTVFVVSPSICHEVMGQDARLPCPSLFPEVGSNSCSLSRWCHPTISSSAALFSFCLHSFPTSRSFQWVDFSHQVAKVLELQGQHQSFPVNIQGWFPLGLTGLILQFNRLSRVFSSTPIQKHQFFSAQPSLWFSHICIWLLEKP